jgi:Flp pilus assembly protein CpaB
VKKMLKFFRSKLFISIILLLMAAILTFAFLPKMYGSQNTTMTVVQFINDVNLGTKISEDMLVTKTIGQYGVDKSVITSKAQIVGKYATNDIRHDTNLYSDMFTDNWNEVDGVIDTLLKDGDKLVTLTLSSGAKSVGGLVNPGDYVDVLTQKASAMTLDEWVTPDDKIEMEMTQLLTHVRVYKLQNNALEDISELSRKYHSLVEANDGSEENFDSSMVPAYVTLIVNNDQAVKLANQEYDGTVHLVLYPEIKKAEDTATKDKDTKPAANTEKKETPAAETQKPVEGEQTDAQNDAA